MHHHVPPQLLEEAGRVHTGTMAARQAALVSVAAPAGDHAEGIAAEPQLTAAPTSTSAETEEEETARFLAEHQRAREASAAQGVADDATRERKEREQTRAAVEASIFETSGLAVALHESMRDSTAACASRGTSALAPANTDGEPTVLELHLGEDGDFYDDESLATARMEAQKAGRSFRVSA